MWSDTSRGEAGAAFEKGLIREWVSNLSERERKIVMYHYLEDQSAQEIADTLGLTVSNVTKIRERALRKMRERSPR